MKKEPRHLPSIVVVKNENIRKPILISKRQKTESRLGNLLTFEEKKN